MGGIGRRFSPGIGRPSFVWDWPAATRTPKPGPRLQIYMAATLFGHSWSHARFERDSKLAALATKSENKKVMAKSERFAEHLHISINPLLGPWALATEDSNPIQIQSVPGNVHFPYFPTNKVKILGQNL